MIIIEHDRLFSRKWKFACSIFLWAAGILKRKTDTHNIIIIIIEFYPKKKKTRWYFKKCEMQQYYEQQNCFGWGAVKLSKLKRKKENTHTEKNRVFLILLCTIIMCLANHKNFNFVNNHRLKNTHCKQKSLYVKLICWRKSITLK